VDVDQAQVVQLALCLFVLPLAVLPTVGAGAVSLGFRLARLPAVPFGRCWRAYLASCCYGFLLLVPIGLLVREESWGAGVRLLAFAGAQLVLVPLLLRQSSRKAVSVTGAAVLLSNLAVFLFVTDLDRG
jgi:hypothetical protein